MKLIKCVMCEQDKPVGEFTDSPSRNPDFARCNGCCKITLKVRQELGEQTRAKARERYKGNIEKEHARKKEYRTKNREKEKERIERWRSANREKVNAYVRKYYHKRKEKDHECGLD